MSASNPLAERLRELRLKSERTMGEVARTLGITPVHYSDVENARKSPFPLQSGHYATLANLYDVNRVELERLALQGTQRAGIALKPQNQRTHEIAVRVARCINEDLLEESEIEAINEILTRKGLR